MSIQADVTPARDLSPIFYSSKRWILTSTMIGSIIEWYDFYIYGTASALIFGKLFFPPTDPVLATLASFLTFALGLFARPFGSIIFGHYGDRLGRKSMLMLSLFLMGVPTVLIGLLPSYASVGFYARQPDWPPEHGSRRKTGRFRCGTRPKPVSADDRVVKRHV